MIGLSKHVHKKGSIMVKYFYDKPVKAVTILQHFNFGCAHCGGNSGEPVYRATNVVIWMCGSESCGNVTCILPDGVQESPVPFFNRLGKLFKPKLERHPFYQDHPSEEVNHADLDLEHIETYLVFLTIKKEPPIIQ